LLCCREHHQEDAMTDVPLARRTVIAGAGAGLVGLATSANAQTEKPEIQAREYWAQKGEVKLYLYRKRMTAKAGETRPVVFLVHGSSISSRPSFDLTVPGKPGYSMMEDFAQHGFDVWTMDHENYGHSSRTKSNSDIANGAADLLAASEVVAKETGLRKVSYLGGSAPVCSRSRRPSGSTASCCAPSPTRARARRKSDGALPMRTNCAPATRACATAT
jgi:pimeloyl-ACP methyl ester carboxylesterase